MIKMSSVITSDLALQVDSANIAYKIASINNQRYEDNTSAYK